jgi:hypothetical protein
MRWPKKSYSEAADKWNDACELRNKLARAILKIPANGRVGDGIHAAAAMALNDDIEGAHEIGEFLHEMSARAGFPVPAKIAKKLPRQAAAAGKAVQSLPMRLVRMFCSLCRKRPRKSDEAAAVRNRAIMHMRSWT